MMSKKYAEITSQIRGGMPPVSNNTGLFNLQAVVDNQIYSNTQRFQGYDLQNTQESQDDQNASQNSSYFDKNSTDFHNNLEEKKQIWKVI